MADAQRTNNVVGECPVCANDGSYCPNPKCPMDLPLTGAETEDDPIWP